MHKVLGDNLPAGPFIILSSVESTNNYAMAKLHAGWGLPGSCFMAVEQTAGKGQRGRKWLARPGENITMSLVLQPFSYNPFLLSAAVALGCYEFIRNCGVENVSIKWPNDLYINDRKAAGILIENSLRGGRWQWAVAGVGMNLNQESFDEGSGRPVSLKMAAGREFDLFASARALHRQILHSVSSDTDILGRYNEVLYMRGRELRVRQGNISFSTTIKEVSADGMLLTHDVIERRFSVGEVEFLLPD